MSAFQTEGGDESLKIIVFCFVTIPVGMCVCVCLSVYIKSKDLDIVGHYCPQENNSLYCLFVLIFLI